MFYTGTETILSKHWLTRTSYFNHKLSFSALQVPVTHTGRYCRANRKGVTTYNSVVHKNATKYLCCKNFASTHSDVKVEKLANKPYKILR